MSSRRNEAPSTIAITSGSVWDLALLPVILGVLILLAFGAKQMAAPYSIGEPIELSLDPAYLPYLRIPVFVTADSGLS